MTPRILAMYLPQFYSTPDNDSWWGDNFTDWVSAKNAKPLFDGHYQPHIPLNDNFYNLLDKNTMKWQSDLMHKFGVDGICMYHYWFKEGRRALEKPEQNLLKWKDIDMPFCFCWANETWARSWDQVSLMTGKSVNIWKFGDDNQTSEKVLLQQSYGAYEQWENHFKYLLPFFQDERYIRVNNAPVFVFYNPREIKCLSEMILFWKRLSKKAGIADINFIGINCDDNTSTFLDANLFMEPTVTIWKDYHKRKADPVRCYDYDEFCKSSLSDKSNREKCYFGGVVGYDDTPRRGLNGRCITNNTPEKFCNYAYDLIRKNNEYGNEFVFMNAWNEWGEGMHLEPDERNGYHYLEALKSAAEKVQSEKENYEGLESECTNFDVNDINHCSPKREKHELYLNLMDQWMRLMEKGLSISGYLKKCGYKKILIYGNGIFGRHLYDDLISGGLEVAGVVDKRFADIKLNCPVISPQGVYPEHDCFMITSIYYKDEILKEIDYAKLNDVLSLDYVIEEMIVDNYSEELV